MLLIRNSQTSFNSRIGSVEKYSLYLCEFHITSMHLIRNTSEYTEQSVEKARGAD